MAFAMWAAMMVGMMLPTAAPTIALYATLVRKHAARGNALAGTWIFMGSFLAVWMAFSLVAAALQVVLQEAALVTPALASAHRELTAAVLIGAGIYQWSPAKDMCLHRCRHPLEFFLTRWRDGTAGAIRMGLEHGAYCVACCWALMLILLVAGAMNPLWIALITALVFVEKLLPRHRLTTRLAGLVLVLTGIVILLRG
jgi:predicted metal-binding membrane protein